MKRSYLLVSFFILGLTACNSRQSQLVVLYKESVDPGNSVVSFLNHDDETGRFASIHCNELKQLYEMKEHIKYICSTVVFEEFKPSIK